MDYMCLHTTFHIKGVVRGQTNGGGPSLHSVYSIVLRFK